MSLYKANALVNDTAGGTTSGTFAINIRSVLYSTGSAANIPLDNVGPDVVPASLSTDVIDAVKDYWGLGALDLVRVI